MILEGPRKYFVTFPKYYKGITYFEDFKDLSHLAWTYQGETTLVCSRYKYCLNIVVL